MVWKWRLLLNMVIFGIYGKFLGCINADSFNYWSLVIFQCGWQFFLTQVQNTSSANSEQEPAQFPSDFNNRITARKFTNMAPEYVKLRECIFFSSSKSTGLLYLLACSVAPSISEIFTGKGLDGGWGGVSERFGGGFSKVLRSVMKENWKELVEISPNFWNYCWWKKSCTSWIQLIWRMSHVSLSFRVRWCRISSINSISFWYPPLN